MLPTQSILHGNCFNEAQRMALELGENGIDAARYRHAFVQKLCYFEATQTIKEEKIKKIIERFYQRHQGEKLRKRFFPRKLFHAF